MVKRGMKGRLLPQGCSNKEENTIFFSKTKPRKLGPYFQKARHKNRIQIKEKKGVTIRRLTCVLEVGGDIFGPQRNCFQGLSRCLRNKKKLKFDAGGCLFCDICRS